jgi:hypothetical protein
MAAGAAVVSVALALERSPMALLGVGATGYFVLRATGRVGARRDR